MHISGRVSDLYGFPWVDVVFRCYGPSSVNFYCCDCISIDASIVRIFWLTHQNLFDLNGKWGFRKWAKRHWKAAVHTAVGVTVTSLCRRSRCLPCWNRRRRLCRVGSGSVVGLVWDGGTSLELLQYYVSARLRAARSAGSEVRCFQALEMGTLRRSMERRQQSWHGGGFVVAGDR